MNRRTLLSRSVSGVLGLLLACTFPPRKLKAQSTLKMLSTMDLGWHDHFKDYTVNKFFAMKMFWIDNDQKRRPMRIESVKAQPSGKYRIVTLFGTSDEITESDLRRGDYLLADDTVELRMVSHSWTLKLQPGDKVAGTLTLMLPALFQRIDDDDDLRKHLKSYNPVEVSQIKADWIDPIGRRYRLPCKAQLLPTINSPHTVSIDVSDHLPAGSKPTHVILYDETFEYRYPLPENVTLSPLTVAFRKYYLPYEFAS